MRAGVYKHYRGGLYQVLGVGQHTESEEVLVVYIPLTGAHLPGPRIRCRPLDGPDGWLTRLLDGRARFVYLGGEVPQEEREQIVRPSTKDCPTPLVEQD